MKNIILLSIFTFGVSCLLAQSPFRIKVIDSESDDPIENALVWIEEIPLGDQTTDINGMVSFQNIPEDRKVRVNVRKSGYLPQQPEIIANRVAKSDNNIVIRLKQKPKNSPIVIYGEVTDNNGNDLKGANIQVSIIGQSFHALTDESGNYQIKIDPELVRSVPSYKIEVKKEGCSTYRNTENSPKQELVLKDIQLQCEKKEIKRRNLIITGAVLNQQGKTLNNASVLLRAGDIKKEVQTDYLGNYSINIVLEEYNYDIKSVRIEVKYNECTKNEIIDVPTGNTIYKDISLLCEIEKKVEEDKTTQTNLKASDPSIDNIKSYLVNNKIVMHDWWTFAYLKEFKNTELINKIKTDDRIEYHVKFNFEDYISGSLHDSEVYIVYKYDSSYNEWDFDEIIMIYITIDYEIPNESWIKITPISNTKWSCNGDYKLGWRTSPDGETIYSGPDRTEKFKLPKPYTNLWLYSREGKPITLKFTYKPN